LGEPLSRTIAEPAVGLIVSLSAVAALDTLAIPW
jgi:hypothetical protein